MKHPTRRHPRGNGAFRWACIPGDGVLTYRMFRRGEVATAWKLSERTFSTTIPRGVIARELRSMRSRLRDAVDAVDLALLGVTEEAA